MFESFSWVLFCYEADSKYDKASDIYFLETK